MRDRGLRPRRPRPRRALLFFALISLLTPMNVVRAACEWQYSTDINHLVRLGRVNLSSTTELCMGCGTIHEEIGNLTQLTSLSLIGEDPSEAYCGTRGTLPATMARLTKLEVLNIRDSDIDGRLDEMPLWGLTNLRSIVLPGAVGIGYVRPGIGSAPSGTLPAALGRLTNLQMFSYKPYSGAPSSISGTLPSELGLLTQLTFLNLAHGGGGGVFNPSDTSWPDISGTLPLELGRLTRLRTVGISAANITGPIPPTLTVASPSLTVCFLGRGRGNNYDTGDGITPVLAVSSAADLRSCATPPRCKLSNSGSLTYRGCSDGGPGSCLAATDSGACALGTDTDYCGPRLRCPKGSEGISSSAGSRTATGGWSTCQNFIGAELGRQIVCVGCAPGKYKDADNTMAEKLAPCKACARGYYAAEAGATACRACPSGRYGPLVQANSPQACFDCPAGTYGNATNATSREEGCHRCPRGTASAFTGVSSAAACRSCPAGQFQNQTGQASCIACAPGQHSAGTVGTVGNAHGCDACRAGGSTGIIRPMAHRSGSMTSTAAAEAAAAATTMAAYTWPASTRRRCCALRVGEGH